jgi:hypothetical protein
LPPLSKGDERIVFINKLLEKPNYPFLWATTSVNILPNFCPSLPLLNCVLL